MNDTQTVGVHEVAKNEQGGVIYNINVPGQTMEVTAARYDTWESYEKDVHDQGWKAPNIAAEAVNKYYPESARKNVKIMDVGAGTGMVAIMLRNAGFSYMDGLDPSTKMLKVARERNLYDNYLEEYLTDKSLGDEYKDFYDIVTGSGCFEPNHIPANALREIIRIVKPGGMVFLTTKHFNKDYWQDVYDYEDKLEAEGLWVKVERVVKPVYRYGYQCMLHVYRVL